MTSPNVETRISRTSTSRVTNGRESAEMSSTTLTVGPKTSAGIFTLLHLAETLEQAAKLGAPMGTPVYVLTGGGLPREPQRPEAVQVTFRPRPLPEAAEPDEKQGEE